MKKEQIKQVINTLKEALHLQADVATYANNMMDVVAAVIRKLEK